MTIMTNNKEKDDLIGDIVTRKNTHETNMSCDIMSVQTSFTKKGKGWECKSCSMLNTNITSKDCEVCGEERQIGKQPPHNASNAVVSGGNNGSSGAAAANINKSNKSSKPIQNLSFQSQHQPDPPRDDPPLEYKQRGNNRHKKNNPKNGGDAPEKETTKVSVVDAPGDTRNIPKKRGMKNRRGKNKDGNQTRKDPESSDQSQSQSLEASKNSRGGKASASSGSKGSGSRCSSSQGGHPVVGGTGLPGEGTSAAIAQLLGLTQDLKIDESKSNNDKSRGGKNRKSNNNKKAAEAIRDSPSASSKKTTFSNEVVDICNAEKLKSKIMGDRVSHEAKSKSKPTRKNKGKGNIVAQNKGNNVVEQQQNQQQIVPVVNRRAIATIPLDGFGSCNDSASISPPEPPTMMALSANATTFVPNFGALQKPVNTVAANSKSPGESSGRFSSRSPGQNKGKQQQQENNVALSNERDNRQPNHNNGKHGKGSKKGGKKGKNQQRQQQNDNSHQNNGPSSMQKGKQSKANLTLQAIRQSKQQQAKNNERTDKTRDQSNTVAAQSNTEGKYEKKVKGDRAVKHQKGGEVAADTGATIDNAKADKKKGDKPAKCDRTQKQHTKEEKQGHHPEKPSAKQSSREVDRKDKKQQNQRADPKKEKSASSSNANGKSTADNEQVKPKAPAIIPPNQPQTTNNLNYGAGRPITVVHIAEKPSIAQVSRRGHLWPI